MTSRLLSIRQLGKASRGLAVFALIGAFSLTGIVGCGGEPEVQQAPPSDPNQAPPYAGRATNDAGGAATPAPAANDSGRR